MIKRLYFVYQIKSKVLTLNNTTNQMMRITNDQPQCLSQPFHYNFFYNYREDNFNFQMSKPHRTQCCMSKPHRTQCCILDGVNKSFEVMLATVYSQKTDHKLLVKIKIETVTVRVEFVLFLYAMHLAKTNIATGARCS